MNYSESNKGCSKCNEPFNFSTDDVVKCPHHHDLLHNKMPYSQCHNCYNRSNECYRPHCYKRHSDGKTITIIDTYADSNRKCPQKPSQCKACGNSNCCSANCYGCTDGKGFCKKSFRESEQKKIWNQVRVPSTMYMMNLAAVNVFDTPQPISPQEWSKLTTEQQKEWLNMNFNKSFKKGVRSQMSDRLLLSNLKNPASVIPSHGNTTRRTTTAARPGASRPGGVGVDVKHNSYARYLARRKGKVLTKHKEVPKPIHGNKMQSYNIINKTCCPVREDPECLLTLKTRLIATILDLVVPSGLEGGDTFTYQTPWGEEITVAVPLGLSEGEQFKVRAFQPTSNLAVPKIPCAPPSEIKLDGCKITYNYTQ